MKEMHIQTSLDDILSRSMKISEAKLATSIYKMALLCGPLKSIALRDNMIRLLFSCISVSSITQRIYLLSSVPFIYLLH